MTKNNPARDIRTATKSLADWEFWMEESLDRATAAHVNKSSWLRDGGGSGGSASFAPRSHLSTASFAR